MLFRRLFRAESRGKTPHEMLFINRLAKVANDPIVQSARPDVGVGAGRQEVVGIA